MLLSNCGMLHATHHLIIINSLLVLMPFNCTVSLKLQIYTYKWFSHATVGRSLYIPHAESPSVRRHVSCHDAICVCVLALRWHNWSFNYCVLSQTQPLSLEMNEYFVIIAYSNNVYFLRFREPFRGGHPKKFFRLAIASEH